MKPLLVGDVFEIDTPKGKAYLHHVFNNPDLVELIRVLPGIYEEQPQNLSELVQGKEEYLIHFPVKAAIKKKILRLIGNYDLPMGFVIPDKFRDSFDDSNGGGAYWQIVDYDSWQRQTFYELTDKQIKLSPWGIWNDTLLIERICQNWRLDEWK